MKHKDVKLYNAYISKNDVPKTAVYIGRGSPYGNPFIIGKDGSRDICCDRYKKEILPKLDIEPLRGKSLVCFCSPKRCHGDSILEALYGKGYNLG